MVNLVYIKWNSQSLLSVQIKGDMLHIVVCKS